MTVVFCHTATYRTEGQSFSD